jgi:hypothetical protein
MDRTYIGCRGGRTNYSCPRCQTVLAFVEETSTGLTYGVPHGFSIDVADVPEVPEVPDGPEVPD